MRWGSRALTCLLLWSLLWGSPTAALQHPNVERGFEAEKVYQVTGLDHVNLFNGNLQITIPIGQSYPLGGGFAYGLTLSYSSAVWDWQVECPGPDQCYQKAVASEDANAGLGWQLHLGQLIPPLTPPRNDSPRWLYLAPDGSEHPFYPTLHEGDPLIAGVSYTRDGSYLRLQEQPGGSRDVEHSDGTVRSFDSSHRLFQISDRFGNHLDVTYPTNNRWHLEDSVGRQHDVFFQAMSVDGRSVRFVQRVKVATFGGGHSDYHFTYAQTSVERPFPHDVPASLQPQWASVPLLTRLSLPDGSTYELPLSSYVLNRGSGVWHSGVLKQMRLPTWGSVEWDWHPYRFPTGSVEDPSGGFMTRPEFFLQKPGVKARRLLDQYGNALGEWRYLPEIEEIDPSGNPQPQAMWTTVTDPLGHKTIHYFSAYRGGKSDVPDATGRHYGLPFTYRYSDGTGFRRYLARQVYDAGGAHLRSVYVKYEHDRPENAKDDYKLAFNPRAYSQRTVYRDDGNRFQQSVSSDFDGLGHYRETFTRSNFPLSANRTVRREYNPGAGTYAIDPATGEPLPGHDFTMLSPGAPWVLGTYSYEDQVEGVTARRQTCFEATTGFLLRERIQKNGTSRDRDDVVVVYERTGNGDVRRERYYGGDTQNVNLGADLCGLALPASDQYRIDHSYQNGVLSTSRYRDAGGGALPYKVLDRDIDFHTGLIKASRDVAGLQTDFEFDSLGRLTWEKPQAGHGSWRQFAYDRATAPNNLAKVRIFLRDNGSKSAPILDRAEHLFDAWGRPWRERRHLPTVGWAERDTYRNALGWPTEVSEWAAAGSWSGSTRYLGYDPFGRPGKIRPPDGQPHDVTLSYQGVRLVTRTVKVGTSRNGNGTISETAASTIEEYDGQQRLWKVTEPPGGLVAEYRYDVGQRLREVKLRGGGSTQTRSFNHDQRGFLISEYHPERGTTTYGDYDARGHAGRQEVGPNRLRFAYDRGERLVSVSEIGSGRPLKEFAYAGSNGAGDWRQGKLVTATRHNYLQAPWSPGTELDAVVTETYVYGGRDGQVSRRDTQLSGTQSFTQSWAYDALGQPTQVGYPRCTHSPCAQQPGAGPPRTVGFDYFRGQLQAVPGYASQLHYHPNGLVAEVRHANGVNYVVDDDPNGMRRPAEIRATGALNLTLGQHRYDGAGNLVQRGEEYYLYDLVSRLKHYEKGSGSFQSYGFDPFGNLTQLTFWDGSTSTTRTMATSRSTNRLTGAAAYDGAGNLTAWGGWSFGYDALDVQTTQDFPAWSHVYTADDERIWTLHWLGSNQPIEERYTLRDLDGRALTAYTTVGGVQGTWTWEKDYVYRDGVLLAAATSEPWPRSVQHFLVDHLGTPRVTSGADASVLAVHHYFGFGEETGAPADPEKMRFTGHERDFGEKGTADDFDYMHRRYYSSHLCRFLSVDPINSGSSADPQSWNKYSYTRGNPLAFVDLDGEKISPPPSVQDRLEKNAEIRATINDQLERVPVVGKGLAVLADVLLSGSIPANGSELNDSLVGVGVPLGTVANRGGSLLDRVANRLLGQNPRKVRFVTGGRARGFVRANSDLPGGESAARKMFQALTGRKPELNQGGRFKVILEDGREIQIRVKSDGTAKLEIFDPNVSVDEKITFKSK